MPGPSRSAQDWPLRAPVEIPTGLHPTDQPFGRWDDERAGLVRSGAVPAEGALTLSEVLSGEPALEAAARALLEVASDLTLFGEGARDAGLDLDDNDLYAAGARLETIADNVRVVAGRLERRIQPPQSTGLEPPSCACPPGTHRRLAPETELERRARDGDR